jgi:hypothetical protein
MRNAALPEVTAVERVGSVDNVVLQHGSIRCVHGSIRAVPESSLILLQQRENPYTLLFLIVYRYHDPTDHASDSDTSGFLAEIVYGANDFIRDFPRTETALPAAFVLTPIVSTTADQGADHALQGNPVDAKSKMIAIPPLTYRATGTLDISTAAADALANGKI